MIDRCYKYAKTFGCCSSVLFVVVLIVVVLVVAVVVVLVISFWARVTAAKRASAARALLAENKPNMSGPTSTPNRLVHVSRYIPRKPDSLVRHSVVH